MSSLRNPVGPQPQAVYWRRRLLVALGVVAVIVVIVLIVVRPGSGEPASTPTPTESETVAPPAESDAAADPTESDAPETAGECAPTDVQVVAVTDAGSYPEGVAPKLSMTITNTSDAICSFNVGTDAQEYVITSGEDRIWSSRDCQDAPEALVVDLEPGDTQTTTPFDWDRTRSSADTCEGERAAVTGGGATYRLAVTLGEVEGSEDKPFILE